MIFHLGKTKSSEDDSVREETFRRWREASQRNEETEADAAQPSRPVEWPDPRATISLTQELPPEQEEEEIQLEMERPLKPASNPVKPVSNFEQLQKTATSKLAQFVSSGFNATSGLLAGNAKPLPANKTAEQLIQKTNIKPVETTVRLVEAPQPAARTQPSEPALSPEEDIKRRFGTNIKSALGPGTIIEGTFSFDSPVCIEGTLMGEVRSNSVLIVGAQATVDARVRVGSLIVMGVVKGDVEAEDLVEIKAGGSLEGDVFSGRFAIEDGGWFQGRCTPIAASVQSQMEIEVSKPSANADVPPTPAAVPAEKWTIE